MNVVRYGSGKDVVIGLHGWSGDHTTFLPLMKYLPAHITFYSVDLPGSGGSPPPEKWELDLFIQEVTEAIVNLGHSKLTLIGSCSGGLFCLFIAKYLVSIEQGNILKRIVLLDPFAYFPWYFQVFVSPRMGRIGWYAYYSTFANPIGRWLTNLSLRKQRQEATNLTDSFADVDHQSTYRHLQLLSQGGSAQQFSKLSMPIDILYGENTFGAVKTSVLHWKRIFPHAQCHLLKGAGHLPLEEATKEVGVILFQ